MANKRILAFMLVLVSFLQVRADDPGSMSKDWTMLVFINGHNNLDGYGTLNMNEMEKVGSTEKINIVVEWASSAYDKTRRILVQKDNNPNVVTSPVVETMPAVDMGDKNSLVDFITWGAAHYPAKHYFVVVWDHGSGWHALSTMNQPIRPMDISYDERTGHVMTTTDLAWAMRTASKAIGQKIDIYGSDACLMQMAEVAQEMADVVDVYVGSQETEPMEGWPYDKVLARWAALPQASAQQVASILVDEYVKSYQKGSHGTAEVTMSAINVTALPELLNSLVKFKNHLLTSNAPARTVVNAINSAQSFTNYDYVDVNDFLTQLDQGLKVEATSAVIQDVRERLNSVVIANSVTSYYANAHGLSMWLPGDKMTYSDYSTAYKASSFDQATQFHELFDYLFAQNSVPQSLY